jgi:tetratricopeptide (TPR) repeat protein
MLRIRARLLVALVLTLVPGALVHASDRAGDPVMTPFFGPLKRGRPQDFTKSFVQKTRNFSLQAAGNRISTSTACLVYRGERLEGDQLLLSTPGNGFRGWAKVSDVVPFLEAEAFFSQQIVRNPRDAFGFLMRGFVRFEKDDCEAALADLNEALRLESTNVAALTTRANLWLLKNRPDLAFADANKAVESDPRNSHAVAERAFVFCTVKQDDNALRDIERAIELGSRSPLIYVARGQIYWKRGELAKAKVELDQALRIEPERADAHLFLAAIYMLQSDPDKAMSAATSTIQIDPNCALAFALRAALYRSIGKDKQALADVNEAIRLEPENASHLQNRAAFKFEKEEYGSALADLDAAIRLDPNNLEVIHGRAWILATCLDPSKKNIEQAVISARRACELTNWNQPRHLSMLAIAYSETGDFAAAARWQEKAIELLPSNATDRRDYVKDLRRYKANKPYHRLGLLEELGLKAPTALAKTAGRTSD